MANTLTYDESGKGWTSFHSFIPDWMQRLNNRFFSMKNGQLYLHNDESNPVRNNFYGVQYPTTIKMIFNDFPSEIKFAKTIKLEANKPFNAVIKSYINDENVSVTQTSLSKKEFLNKEGLLHAFFRRNEIESDLSARNAYGLGRVLSVAGNIITMTKSVPLGSISIGDTLLDENQNTLGTIQSYSGSNITLDSIPIVLAGSFILGYKNARIEGSEIRGYNFELDLIDDSSTRTEIFAANIGAVKSHPS